MAKIHCNIIHDLLPSYVDKIASEESNQMIEDHFRECKSCKKVYETLKENDFVVEKADAGIAGYLKKLEWKKRVEHRGMLLLTVFLFLLQIFLNFGNNATLFGDYVTQFSLYIANCIFYPMYVILLRNILGTWKEHRFYSKTEKGILTIEGISLFYMIGMFYCLFIKMANGETRPYGLETHQTGPFLNGQLIVFIVVYFLMFFVYFILRRKERKYNQNIMIMLLAGIAIFLNIRVGMHGMESVLSMIKVVSICLGAVIIESILLSIFVMARFSK